MVEYQQQFIDNIVEQQYHFVDIKVEHQHLVNIFIEHQQRFVDIIFEHQSRFIWTQIMESDKILNINYRRFIYFPDETFFFLCKDFCVC